MTIEELKRLKPLDITKLDKSQWEDANAVLGVDSNDDVVMATPEDFAKESEIQEIISDISDIRTSITSGDTETLESAKAYTDDKLGDYYTKNEVEEKIDEATSGITVDAYTKAEADARFQPIGDYATEAYVTAATADFVTSGDVETQVSDFTYSKAVIDEKVAGGGSFDPTQYYTKTEVDNEISAATQDLVTSGEVETQITSKGYATTGYVDSAISGISIPTKTSDLTNDSGFITESALSGLASETYVDNAVSGKVDSSTFNTYTGDTATVLEGKADTSDIPDVSNFVTSGDVETQITEKGYATTTYVDNAVSSATVDMATTGDVATAVSGLASESYVTNAITAATDDMATQTWVNNQGFLTQHQDISGKLDVSVFTGYTGATETVLESKADITDIPDVSGFVTSGDVETQITSKGYATEAYVTAATADMATTGDVASAVSGLASETYVDSAVTAATVDMATTGDVATAVSGLASENYVDAAITAATDDMATQTWVQNQGYLTQHQDISGKLDTTVFTGYTASTETVLAGKANTSDIPDVSNFVTSGDVATQVSDYTYSKAVIDEKVASGGTFDPTQYYTKTQVDNAISSATEDLASEAYVTAATADFVTSGDVETQITSKNYATTGYVDSAVSGLASESYVTNAITAATSDFVTSGEVETQITGKGYITESALVGYATEAYVTAATEDMATTGDVQTAVSGLASESYVTNAVTAATVDMATTGDVASAVSGLASESYVTNAVTAATDDMATQTWVGQQGFLTEHQDISGKLDTSVFTGYTASTETVLESKADVTDIPDVSGFVTSGEVESQITGKGYITESALSGYATEAYVTAATQDFVTSGDVETQITGKGYATTGDVASAVSGLASESYVTNAVTAATDDMATQTWVQNQGYLTQHQDISGKLDTTVFTGYTASTETVLESKANVSDIPDVSGFVTSGDVETQITAATQNFVTSGDVESQITGKGYATTSYVDNGLADKADKVKTSTTTITILDTTSDEWETNKLGAFHLTSIEGVLANETAANSNVFSCGGVGYISSEGDDVTLEIGQSTTLVEGSGLIRADEAGYYILDTRGSSPVLTLASGLTTTVEFDVVYEDDLDGYASEAYVTAATQNFVTSGDVETQITAATQNFVTSGDVETQITSKNYATTGYVDSAVSGLASENYVDSAITAATADMATTGDVAAKQDILVSGTNIKTINNQSILGSGNIEIQGGGGTGGTEYYAGTNISIDSDNYINVTGITSQVNTYWVDGGSSQYVESGTGYDLYTTYVESSGHDVMSANTDVRIFSSRIYGQSTNQSYYLQQHDVDQWYGITNTGSCIELDTVYDIVDAGTDSSNLTNPIVVSGFTDYFDVYYCFDMVNMKFWASKTIKYSVTGPQSLVYGTMPYAQDGSPKKGYIYDAGQYGKRVVSRAEISALQLNGKLGVQTNLYFWGNSSSSESTNTVFLPTATASADGVMSAGDKSRFNDINSGLAITSAYTIGSSTSGDTNEYYFEINSTNYYFNKTNVSGVYVLSYTPSSTDTWFYVHSNYDDGQGGTQMKMWQWSETFITDASSFPIEKSLTENWSGSYINFGSFASQMYFIWDTNNNVMLFKTDLNYVSGYKTIATTDYVDGIVGNIESILQTI